MYVAPNNKKKSYQSTFAEQCLRPYIITYRNIEKQQLHLSRTRLRVGE